MLCPTTITFFTIVVAVEECGLPRNVGEEFLEQWLERHHISLAIVEQLALLLAGVGTSSQRKLPHLLLLRWDEVLQAKPREGSNEA